MNVSRIYRLHSVRWPTTASSFWLPSVREIGNAQLESYTTFYVSLGNIFSIAFFNFAGISVTKELSSTTRVVLDSGRTLIIWAISLAFQWQKFYPLQIVGFILLVTGALHCSALQ